MPQTAIQSTAARPGDDHRRAARLRLERAQDRADALLVVVGGRHGGTRGRTLGDRPTLGRDVERRRLVSSRGVDPRRRLRRQGDGLGQGEQLRIVFGGRKAGPIVATPGHAGREQRMHSIFGRNLEAAAFAVRLVESGSARLGHNAIGPVRRQGRRFDRMVAEVEGFLDRRQRRSRRILSFGGVGHSAPRHSGRAHPAAVRRPSHYLLTKTHSTEGGPRKKPSLATHCETSLTDAQP